MDLFEHLKRHLDEEEVKKLEDSLKKEAVNSLYLNPLMMSSEAFLKEFPLVTPNPFLTDTFYYPKEYNFGKRLRFDLGCYYIQDASACIVPYVLNPQPNERILDMCASPGGKAIRIASLMQNTGIVVANDNSFSRVLTLSQNVERFGLINVLVTTNNMLYMVLDYENYFDRVLLDAPCSGSGMSRKEPKMLEDWNENKVLKLVETQKTLIDNAISYCKPGGIVVYSTCSYSYEENEEIIQYALNSGKVELVTIEPFDGSYHHKSLPGTLRLHPSRYNGEGQFVAKLRKKTTGLANASIKFSRDFKSDPPIKNILEFPHVKYWSLNKASVIATSFNEDLKFMQVFKTGMELGKREDFGFVYHHEASRLINPLTTHALNEKDAIAYIEGRELQVDLPDGWHIVSYKNVNLGFIRIKNTTAKNYYPKGLRKRNIVSLNITF